MNNRKKWSTLRKKGTAAVLGMMLGVSSMAVSVQASLVDLNAVFQTAPSIVAEVPQGPEITSTTGVVMEAETGTVIYDKGADAARYPASITKLMTLLLAVENSTMDEVVTFTETGIRDVTPDSGNIGMQLGEQMTMQDCIYAMHIYSANEVAAQIAEHVGGTEQEFINMMNARALEIGCTNTFFTNASGLPDENMHTCAKDMALIVREGLKNETFRQVLSTVDYTIPATNLNPNPRELHTHQPLFAPESALYYQGCIGGKTGMTNDAGHTMVTVAERDGLTFIAVTMKAADLGISSADTISMLDYSYAWFQKAWFEQLAAAAAQPLEETPAPEVQEPVEEVGSADEEPLYQEEEAGETEEKTVVSSRLTELRPKLLIALAVMIVLTVILFAILVIKKKKRRKNRKKRK